MFISLRKLSRSLIIRLIQQLSHVSWMFAGFLTYFADTESQIARSVLLPRRRLLVDTLCGILDTQTNVSIFEVGCGKGQCLHLLRSYFPFAQLSGCDISPFYVRQAKLYDSNLGVSLRSFSELDYYSEHNITYDVVFTFDSLIYEDHASISRTIGNLVFMARYCVVFIELVALDRSVKYDGRNNLHEYERILSNNPAVAKISSIPFEPPKNSYALRYAGHSVIIAYVKH